MIDTHGKGDYGHMSGITKSVRSRKKERTRKQLIDTAIALFSRQGIENTTVEQIALEAGTGKGTVYNYFATKEDLIVAFMADLELRAQPTVKRFAELDAPLAEILSAFAWNLLDAKRRYRMFVRSFLARIVGPDDSFQTHVLEMQKAIDTTLTMLFSRLQQRGIVRKDLDLQHLQLTFKTMHLGLTVLWALEGSPWRETRKVLTTEMAMMAKGIEV